MSRNLDLALNLLSGVYQKAMLNILLKTEELVRSGRSTAHARAALQEVTLILQELNGFSDEWIQQTIPAAYREGWDETFRLYDKKLGAELSYSSFAKVNQQAVEVVAYNLRDGLQGAHQQVGRQVQDIYRKVGLENAQSRLIEGEAYKKASAKMKAQLITQKIHAFKDAAGRMWTLDSYCTMVARTTTREAVTFGTMNRALAGGYDLVMISEHHPTCELCAPLQGKVYSLTGQTPGYPLYENFVPVHPNCLHNIRVYIPRYDSEAESRKAYSNTSLAKDPRSDTEKAAYGQTQAANQQLRDLRAQYQRYVGRLGEEAGTIQNFAQSKKRETDRYKELQSLYREVGKRPGG